jgi:hypothetical protein
MNFRLRLVFVGLSGALVPAAVGCSPGPSSTAATHAQAPSPGDKTDDTGSQTDETQVAAPGAADVSSSGDEAASSATASTSALAEVDRERSVLILGDSLAATAFGALLERELDAHESVRCSRKAKSSTGLARPDFFDWMVEGAKQVEAKNPELVVVILGGNDGQDLAEKSGKSGRVGWQTPQWSQAYTARMRDFVNAIGSNGQRRVMVLGLPQTETTKFEEKLRIIRKAQRDAIDQLSTFATYLDTTPLLSDEKGELRRDVKIGKEAGRLHADDGIHFTMTGSKFFAQAVYPEVLRELGLAAKAE